MGLWADLELGIVPSQVLPGTPRKERGDTVMLDALYLRFSVIISSGARTRTGFWGGLFPWGFTPKCCPNFVFLMPTAQQAGKWRDQVLYSCWKSVKSWYSSIYILTRLWTGRPVFDSRQGRDFLLSSPLSPNRFYCPPSLLSHGNRPLFPLG